jgi:hypothetical protein
MVCLLIFTNSTNRNLINKNYENKILVLLLLAFSSVSIAQTTVIIKKNNGNTTAPFVAVIESNGEVNKIADLIDVLNFASAVNLPTTGLAGKIYVTDDIKFTVGMVRYINH